MYLCLLKLGKLGIYAVCIPLYIIILLGKVITLETIAMLLFIRVKFAWKNLLNIIQVLFYVQ